MSDTTFTTYESIGQAEDVSDIISNIAPFETPFYSNAKKGKTSSKRYDWQTQDLTAAATNSAVEGADPTAPAVTPTVLISNYTNISEKSYKTSGTEDAIKQYGRAKEHAYQTVLKGRELRRDVEVTLLANQAYDAGSSASARVVGGLPAYLTNINTTSGTASSGKGTTAYVPGTVLRTPTISMYFDAHQSAYDDGGNPTMLMMSSVQKRKLSSLVLGSGVSDTADIRYTTQKDAPATAIGAVDVLLSDFGPVDTIINRQMTSNFLKGISFFLDPEHYSVKELRPFQNMTLAKTGDSTKSQILIEYTLEVSAPNAHAAVADLAIT
jgi:hypothetical protein